MLVGDNVADPTGEEQKTKIRARRSATTTRLICIENDGDELDSFVLRGTGGSGDFGVRYFAGHIDITEAVVAGTYRVVDMLPRAGAQRFVRMKLWAGPRARSGAMREFVVGVRSEANPAKEDVAKVKLTVTTR